MYDPALDLGANSGGDFPYRGQLLLRNSIRRYMPAGLVRADGDGPVDPDRVVRFRGALFQVPVKGIRASILKLMGGSRC